MGYRVYLLTSKTTGLQYVGCTKLSLRERLNGHWRDRHRTSPVATAILKYGKEDFTIKLLKTFRMEAQALDFESEKVKELKTWHPHGLNATKSGGPSEFTENTRENHRLAMSNGKHPMLGKKHSETTIEGYRENRKGSGNSFYGKSHSLESRMKISESKRGNKNPMWGKSPNNDVTGSNNPNAKITEEIAKKIKEYLSKQLKVSDISVFLGVSRSTIYGIKKGKLWKSV